MKMIRVLVITGTPAVGKTTLAKKIHESLRSSILIDVNKLALAEGLVIGIDQEKNAKIVDLDALSKAVNKEIEKADKECIILEGHLLSEIKISNARVVVIRAHLKNLINRQKRRGYDTIKIKDNLVSEALDYCGEHARANYGNVIELFADDDRSVEKAITFLYSKAYKDDRYIDLSQELEEIVKRKPEFAI